MKRFEINSDLGELSGNDEALMPHLDACSIACGGHAGDENSMRDTVRLAKKYRVKVGAHPAFPDRKNFGRQVMDISAEELENSLLTQIRYIETICKEEGVPLDHIKPHGALYNLAAKEENTAKIVARVAKQFPGLTLYTPWKSVLAELAKKETVPVKFEGFADRKYAKDRSLVSRSNANAIITDPNTAAEQVYIILTESKLITNDWSIVPMKAQTFCVHGDNPAAPDIAKRLNQLRA